MLTGMSGTEDRYLSFAMKRGWALLATLVMRLTDLFEQADSEFSGAWRHAILNVLRPAEALARRLLVLQASMQREETVALRERPFPAGLQRRLKRKPRARRKARLPLIEPIRIAHLMGNARRGPVPSICRKPMPNPNTRTAEQQLHTLKLRFEGLRHACDKPEYYVRNILKWTRSRQRGSRFLPIRTSCLPARGMNRLGAEASECLLEVHDYARQVHWPPWPPSA